MNIPQTSRKPFPNNTLRRLLRSAGVLAIGLVLVGSGAAAKTLKVSGRGFDKKVLQATEPVLVDFTASWCAPCRRLDGAIEELAAQVEGVRVVQVKLGSNRELVEEYGVTHLPTLILFHGGEEVERRVGALSADTLEHWLEVRFPAAMGIDQPRPTVQVAAAEAPAATDTAPRTAAPVVVGEGTR